MNHAIKILAGLVLAGLLITGGCSKGSTQNGEDISKRISLASQLEEKGLYDEAALEYEAALETPGLSPAKRSNLYYILGNLHYEKKKDYEKALANFIRAKHYNPQSPELQKITEKTVVCLERIGRSLDARNVLSDATYLAGEETREFTGKTVAQIGDRKITMGELNNEIQKLPPETQKKLGRDDKEKLEFLRQYVQKELLYNMAKRSGFDKDQEIRQQMEDLEKMLLVQKVYQTNVTDKISVTPDEVRLYFKAHKDDLAKAETRSDGKKTSDTKQTVLSDDQMFEKNAQKIMNMIRMEKASKKEAELLEKLMRSDQVIIFEGEFNK
jgi:tetratricopeptide (TPR) repeat protein